MFYYLYEIKNIVNNKIYVGIHKTKNINDGYMGSGKIIKNAIEKYGIENFVKTIIEYFSTPEEMFAREKEVVNESFLRDHNTYNLRRGGTGGFDYINKNKIVKFKGKKHSESSKLKMGHLGNKHWLGKKHTKETREKIGLKSKGRNTGFKHSEETKQKISKANLKTNESRSKKVSKALKNKSKTEEHRKKLSDAIKKWHAERQQRKIK